MSDSPQTPMFSDRPEEEQIAQYRGVSILAVLALLISLLATLAMFGPMFWPIPLAGAAMSALALARIQAADPKPLGRSVAMLALFMSILIGTAAPSHYFFRQAKVRGQAQELADEWFNLLRRRQYPAAVELSMAPSLRESLGGNLDALYQVDEQRQERLQKFVEGPHSDLIRTVTILLQRGGEARFYQVDNHTTSGGTDHMALIYAITFQDQGEKKSFFVRLVIKREDDVTSARGRWQILGWDGPVRL